MKNVAYAKLLNYIDPASLDYQQWVNVGMALCEEGESWEAWDAWSQRDPARYHRGECEKKWNSFGYFSGPRVTGAFIMELAKTGGYVPKGEKILSWDDEIEYDGPDDNRVVDDIAMLETESFVPQTQNWNPVEELRLYLTTLFDPQDIVAYNIDSWKDDDGKYKPSGNGVYGRTSGDLLKSLNKHPNDITDTIGSYNEEAGGWIRFNPMDGQGIKNSNVKEFRYSLVESDSMELEKQIAILKKMELPIAVLLYSGSKSIHAIVRIDAENIEEYQERTNYLYQACKTNGLLVDTQNKNPARLSRMPGLMRNGKQQRIIDTNIGKKSWEEWYDYIDGISDNLPECDDFLTCVNAGLPDLNPELIGGILREGHKMLLSGPSKAGKSFALIELAIAIATGTKWMGLHQCKKGKVMYLNFELDRKSCLHRFYDVYQALDIPMESVMIWNLRGNAMDLKSLRPKLLRRARNENYSAIILDPIYKVQAGDENSAKDISAFCNELDKISVELNTALIYCHHHSKGAQGNKAAVDRSSGSGVFGRDADVIMDMIELDPGDVFKSLGDAESAWRMEYTLREFPYRKPDEVLFTWPLHEYTEDLKDAQPKHGADPATKGRRGGNKGKEKKEEKIEVLENWVQSMIEITGRNPTLKEFLDKHEKYRDRTVRNWIQDGDTDLILKNGILCFDDENLASQ